MRRLAIASLFLLGALPAAAHHLEARAGVAQGLAIPSLSHGQMAVIAAYRQEILRLAEAHTPTDPVMRRLQGYISLQTFACLWGLAPDAVEDESSPFNECSHAYLAGVRALFVHLQSLPGDHAAVRALTDRIELAMLQNNASLVLCRYSDSPFDTADIIGPHWSEIPFHPKTCLWFAAIALALAGCFWLALRPNGLRRPPLAK
jgi:hypothetical protein